MPRRIGDDVRRGLRPQPPRALRVAAQSAPTDRIGIDVIGCNGMGSVVASGLGNVSFRTNRKVHWDASAHRFRDNAEANRMLTPRYRGPWQLPSVYRRPVSRAPAPNLKFSAEEIGHYVIWRVRPQSGSVGPRPGRLWYAGLTAGFWSLTCGHSPGNA